MLRTAHRANGGIAADLGLYLAGVLFAGFTAVASTLPAHRAWGQIAFLGYAVTAALATGQLVARARGLRGAREGRRASRLWDNRARALVLGVGWLGSTLVPLVAQAAQRAAGHPHRAQEEVAVVELGAARLLDTGTPYLTRDAIAAAAEPLLSYLPYQPGMVVFGLPRALAGDAWWTDARIYFAIATAAALAAALRLTRFSPGRDDQGEVGRGGGGARGALVIRAAQVVTVLPVCALTLATGGDDLPVLALCLLALAYAGRGRWTASGVAVGAAAALKLFAWPVAAVLLFHALTSGKRPAVRFAVPAAGLPIAALLPFLLVEPSGVAENLVRFPLGMGLVESPAASPLPGHLIATLIPGGRAIAAGLLIAAAIAIAAWLVRRPPTTAGAAAAVCATGLLIAIMLMPATRFGYLLYPAAYAVWAIALTPSRQPATAPSHET